MKNAIEMIEGLALEVESKIMEEMKYASNHGGLAIFCDNRKDPATQSYMRNKQFICEKFGIKCTVLEVKPEKSDFQTMVRLIAREAEYGSGIIVQLPFYNYTQQDVAMMFKMAEAEYGIRAKDVDGFYQTYEKSGNLYDLPATSLAVYDLIEKHVGDARKTIAVVGQSDLVTKPLAKALIERRHTVISMNSLSDNILLRYADVVVLATGQLQAFSGVDLSLDTFVIDVGIGRLDGKLCGDFKPDDLPCNESIMYTPVPKGVGQLTTRYLVLKLARMLNWEECSECY